MPNDTQLLEKRLAKVEAELADLKAEFRGQPKQNAWLDTVGRFKDDPVFDEAMRLGAEWRRRENEKSIRELERRGEINVDPGHGSPDRTPARGRNTAKISRRKR